MLRPPVAEEHTIRLFSPDEIDALLATAGFELVTILSGGAFSGSVVRTLRLCQTSFVHSCSPASGGGGLITGQTSELAMKEP